MFPNLKERARSPGTRLSGGEQQMLAMARILRTGARLLMLDEIDGGPRPRHRAADRPGDSRDQAARLHRCCWSNRTSASPSTVADRHYVIDHGQVVEVIERNEVEAKQDRLNALLGI
jgi:branched-chain amino acid transport system ATP-binding protein